jgi:hypothetical protein
MYTIIGVKKRKSCMSTHFLSCKWGCLPAPIIQSQIKNVIFFLKTGINTPNVEIGIKR